jgi:hypothetical protein
MLLHFHQPRLERLHVSFCTAAEALHREEGACERWCDYQQLDQRQGALEEKLREGLCSTSVILVCLTPRYLTRLNCVRELQ